MVLEITVCGYSIDLKKTIEDHLKEEFPESDLIIYFHPKFNNGEIGRGFRKFFLISPKGSLEQNRLKIENAFGQLPWLTSSDVFLIVEGEKTLFFRGYE